MSEPTEPTEPLELFKLTRRWHFGTFPLDRGPEDPGVVDSQVGGEVHRFHDYGPLLLGPDGSDSRADSEIFASADGFTYYVSTEGAPAPNGSNVVLEQLMSFRKDSADASLVFTVSGISLVAIDDNSDPTTCPVDTLSPGFGCELMTEVSLDIIAYIDTTTLFQGSGAADLVRVPGFGWALLPNGGDFWGFDDFTTNFKHLDPLFLARPALVTLNRSIPIEVDISRVGLEEEFSVRVRATAETYNVLRRESYVSAFFRDPAGIGGTIGFTGLEPTNNPLPPPPPGIWDAAPECTTPNAAAGVLQFSAATFSATELPFSPNPITITRTGGTSGPVSATFTTRDGTAIAGQHYVAVTTTVAFRDGDDQPRTVTVPVLANTDPEPDRTVNLSLSDPRGCATLGASSSVLSVRDDDQPVAPPVGFSIGGTVTGLTGSGLVLTNTNTGENLDAGNGPFTFVQRLPDGFDYDVVVGTQPANPTQVCSVARGSGTVAGADVTDIAVTCVTPAPVSGLDPAFDGDGKVTTPVNAGQLEAVVVQSDGKLVAAGRSAPSGSRDFALARYNSNGGLDAAFGTGGTVNTPFTAGRNEEATDLALQADGKIVVVGFADDAAFDPDFAVARYLADGSLDPTFGTGGLVTTDFGGGATGTSFAQSVVIQPDGKIVVAGHASLGAGGTGNDFAVARYNIDGSLDSSFSTDGKVMTDLVGTTDLGQAVALQEDGRIVVGGRAAGTGQAILARYEADGGLDSSFGNQGIVTTDPKIEAANGLVIQTDGRIVIAGFTGVSGTGSFDFALARFDGNGSPDPGFGIGGLVFTDLSGEDDFGEDLALQADGKLLVIGRRTSTTILDLAITRYLANGSPDGSFGTGGKVEVDFFGAGDIGQGIGAQPDGKIVGVGSAVNGTVSDFALVRVLP